MPNNPYVNDGEILSMVGWIAVDKTGHERLMVFYDEDQLVALPLLAFDRFTEDRIDGWARAIVDRTGVPARKYLFRRDRLAGEFFPTPGTGGENDEPEPEKARETDGGAAPVLP